MAVIDADGEAVSYTHLDVYKRQLNALVLCGAIPVDVNPQTNAKLGISLGMAIDQVARAIEENPDAKAVLVNNPTYYGICSDPVSYTHLAVPAGWLANFLISYVALRTSWPTE